MEDCDQVALTLSECPFCTALLIEQGAKSNPDVSDLILLLLSWRNTHSVIKIIYFLMSMHNKGTYRLVTLFEYDARLAFWPYYMDDSNEIWEPKHFQTLTDFSILLLAFRNYSSSLGNLVWILTPCISFICCLRASVTNLCCLIVLRPLKSGVST